MNKTAGQIRQLASIIEADTNGWTLWHGTLRSAADEMDYMQSELEAERTEKRKLQGELIKAYGVEGDFQKLKEQVRELERKLDKSRREIADWLEERAASEGDHFTRDTLKNLANELWQRADIWPKSKVASAGCKAEEAEKNRLAREGVNKVADVNAPAEAEKIGEKEFQEIRNKVFSTTGCKLTNEAVILVVYLANELRQRADNG